MMGKKGMGTHGLLEAIKEAVPLIVANYSHPVNCERSKSVMADLVVDIEAKSASIERLYLMYNIIELLEPLSEAETSKFFAAIFPIPLKKDVSSFISQLVSLSLSLNCHKILSACSIFISKNQITFPGSDIESLPENLAQNSPTFITTILNKGNITQEIFTPKLIATWLIDLIHNPSITPFIGEGIINYALLGPGVIRVERLTSSELHLRILELIEKKKIQPLTSQYVIDLAVMITNYNDQATSNSTDLVTIRKSEVIERFCQFLFVAFESGVVAKFPNSLKKKMNNLFPNHDLMTAAMKYK